MAAELPEQLRRYEGCLDAEIPTTAKVGYSRLGLVNTANTCYVNVVVQSLMPCNALLWVLRRCGSAGDPRRPMLCAWASLCKEFHTRQPDAHGETLNALMIPQVKDVVASWQRLGAQQDASEFLYYLLSNLHDESKWKVRCPATETDIVADNKVQGESVSPNENSEEGGGGAWAHLVKTNRRQVEMRNAGLHEDSPITRIFGGITQSAVRARSAKADSVSLEPFNHLDLDISASGVTSIRTALQAFCNPEAVGDGQATRRIQMKVLPKVLILNLKRFAYVKDSKGRGGAQKISKPIKYEEKLVFDRSWLAEDAASEEYFMSALICHHGDSVHKGHYTCIARYNSEWYLYDDTVVKRIEAKEVGSQQYTVYLLVYQSRSSVSFTP